MYRKFPFKDNVPIERVIYSDSSSSQKPKNKKVSKLIQKLNKEKSKEESNRLKKTLKDIKAIKLRKTRKNGTKNWSKKAEKVYPVEEVLDMFLEKCSIQITVDHSKEASVEYLLAESAKYRM